MTNEISFLIPPGIYDFNNSYITLNPLNTSSIYLECSPIIQDCSLKDPVDSFIQMMTLKDPPLSKCKLKRLKKKFKNLIKDSAKSTI